jgi:hypothetical protein
MFYPDRPSKVLVMPKAKKKKKQENVSLLSLPLLSNPSQDQHPSFTCSCPA